MKTTDKTSGYLSDDDNVRYMLNTNYFNNEKKSPSKVAKKHEKINSTEVIEDIRYRFPKVLLTKTKFSNSDIKPKSKPKPKIKVNFWTGRNANHVNEPNKKKSRRRHTVGGTIQEVVKPKKVRKQVSFLPSPLFSDNHIPMVTVPDDLTINFNEEEANDMAEDLNQAFVNSAKTSENVKSKPNSLNDQINKTTKRKRSPDTYDNSNDNELEFFSKYVVQKLRKMETNQRIYSENLINTVLMFGQLGKLNGKSKIGDV